MNRFWSKVQKTDTCWLWSAAVRRKDDGYGAFWLDGRHQPAHGNSRLSDESAARIREAVLFGARSADLAGVHGVSRQHIWKIASRGVRAWA